jgi:hypothetical protein
MECGDRFRPARCQQLLNFSTDYPKSVRLKHRHNANIHLHCCVVLRFGHRIVLKASDFTYLCGCHLRTSTCWTRAEGVLQTDPQIGGVFAHHTTRCSPRQVWRIDTAARSGIPETQQPQRTGPPEGRSSLGPCQYLGWLWQVAMRTVDLRMKDSGLAGSPGRRNYTRESEPAAPRILTMPCPPASEPLRSLRYPRVALVADRNRRSRRLRRASLVTPLNIASPCRLAWMRSDWRLPTSSLSCLMFRMSGGQSSPFLTAY